MTEEKAKEIITELLTELYKKGYVAKLGINALINDPAVELAIKKLLQGG